jgi:hypothetical protein
MKRSTLAWLLVAALGFIALLVLLRPRCPRPTLGSWLSLVGPSGVSWPSAVSRQPLAVPVRTTLFGPSEDQLIITVPPNPDTVRILVGPDLLPRPIGPISPIGPIPFSAVRRHSLIRFRPSVHLCVLFEPSAVSRKPLAGFAAGLKLRPVELGRFGLAGYVCLSSTKSTSSTTSISVLPGLGLDYRLLGNLSADAAILWRISSFPSSFSPQPYLGLSLRL